MSLTPSRKGSLSKRSTRALLCLLVVLPSLASQRAFALEPPSPGEIAALKRTGEWEARLAQARALGNDRIDAGLLERVQQKAAREALIQQGAAPEAILPPPPAAWQLMPTTGNVKVFALLIDFLDYPAYSTQPAIHSALFGDGSLIPSNAFPYESLNNFYERSSYNQLHLSAGVTLGWYHAPYNRSAVPQTVSARQALIKEAIGALHGAVDFSQFDNDGDGQIEYFIVIWTGPNNGWSNFWWGYQTRFVDPTFIVDGKTLGKYSWQWEGYYGSYGPFSPHTVIHETGHGLGLPDYYDYDDTVGPDGGVGGLDMMDGNWGDHNSFSKWVLDWITPIVVASGSQTITLNPSATSPDAVLIMPGATSSDPFREFFIAQNRYRIGNDGGYPADGMLIWHVDATLNLAGSNYAYNNSYTDHKLIKLMQADGLDRIENYSASADAAMYYTPGKSLGPLTNPRNRDYIGVDTGVNVTGISQSGLQMTATFSIDDPRVLPALTVAKAGNGDGTITSDLPGISCGPDCRESYAQGTMVTLRVAPVPGWTFVWSGGGCSGSDICTVTMSADTTVTATFAPRHDSVVLPLRPRTYVIDNGPHASANGHFAIIRNLKVTVRNADFLPPPKWTAHTIQLSVSSADCPVELAGTPDFGAQALGPPNVVSVPAGKSRTAKVPLTIVNSSFTTFNHIAPTRCTLAFVATAAGSDADGIDPTPQNNVAPVEINIIDRNDPEGTATHESLIKSIAPVKLKLKKNSVAKTQTVRPIVINADILPVAEPGTDAITVTASDGDCPSGTVGLADYDAATPGPQGVAQVAGGKAKPGTLPVTIHPAGFFSPTRQAPGRCTAVLTATGPGGDSDGSNNVTKLVIDVTDGNDL